MRIARVGQAFPVGIAIGAAGAIPWTGLDANSGGRAIRMPDGSPKLEITCVDAVSTSPAAFTVILAATALGVGAAALYIIVNTKDGGRNAVRQQFGDDAGKWKTEIRSELADFQEIAVVGVQEFQSLNGISTRGMSKCERRSGHGFDRIAKS